MAFFDGHLNFMMVRILIFEYHVILNIYWDIILTRVNSSTLNHQPKWSPNIGLIEKDKFMGEEERKEELTSIIYFTDSKRKKIKTILLPLYTTCD